MYHDQIKWLSQGNWKTLIDEQLRFKKQLHLLCFGSEVSSLRDKPQDTCPLRLRECCAWVTQLRAAGGCDLLRALQRVLTRSELDTLLIILGSRPDQTVDIICDFLIQNRTPSVHCSSPDAIETVKQMVAVSGGRYHLFSAALGVVDSSTDIDLLWAEIKAAQSKVLKSVTFSIFHFILSFMCGMRKRLMGAVRLFERRVQWLNRIWGTVCEQRVQVLLDMSGMNAHYQLHLQHALRILLQEQLANKHSFNIIVFGSDVKSWQEKMVPSTHENLQAVWQSADQRKTNVSQSVFFMEDGNLGVVFNKYPKPNRVCTSITTIKLPKHEDICSAKQWLKRFGTKNLKLDLHKLISGPECCHHNKLVLSVHKRVSAKYCAIFPSVLINVSTVQSGARFHQAPENTDPALIRKLLSDLLSGDDLRKLSEEIEKLRMFQKQAKAFRETILELRDQEGM
ncbi:von Willebrand factor A domain-containing protein 3A-like [Sinocyclocheilus rhinocerous]|uniref:von Willebrand factor A domain-containing protein 3A-like n=1 Tax=Sinocyclocheilus rhinocerous TaxID=307959 RepID=UPI0007B829B1|nr:PREDICTED: von Willebrand factor A domain-containing protein 3A-like [Sinocyclocheilus rhinocerous]